MIAYIQKLLKKEKENSSLFYTSGPVNFSSADETNQNVFNSSNNKMFSKATAESQSQPVQPSSEIELSTIKSPNSQTPIYYHNYYEGDSGNKMTW